MTAASISLSPIETIQELSFDEVEMVEGGIVPLLAFAAGVLFGAAVAAGADYLDGGFND